MSREITHRDRATDLGIVRIDNEAIMTIAAVAAMEVRGICRLGGGIGKTLYETFFRKTSSKGVRIKMKDSEIVITVSVVVEYGSDIPRIADQVQDSVKRAVERMTGLVLSEVDVIVEGVRANSCLTGRPGTDTIQGRQVPSEKERKI